MAKLSLAQHVNILTARLSREQRGATIVEFGFVAPVLAVLLMGALDLGHTLYMRTVLQGVVQKSARDSSLEGAAQSARRDEIDAYVTTQVRNVAKNATVTISRRYYKTFSEAAAAQAETFTDTNTNNRCDAGEPYQDRNNNSTWDADGGNSGQGGAQDDVVYTADISYPRLFPMDKLIGLSGTVRVKAVTVLENQPYSDQTQYGAATVRNCT